MFTVRGHAVGIGFLLALLTLIVVIVFAITGAALTRDWLLAGFAALALAVLLP
jgi:hypothetical protein